MPPDYYSETSINEHLHFAHMFQSLRSIFAVNTPPQDEHLPTLNNEFFFQSFVQKKPLYSEYTVTNCAFMYEIRR
jgi:hypothetical protein